MRKRKRLSKKASMSNFRRTARKVSRKNLRKTLHRGGYNF